MADHVRQQLRESIRHALEEATGFPVFTNRMQDLEDVELPAIIVTTENETSTLDDDILSRDVETMVVLIMEAGAELDKSLDDFALKIETALRSPPSPARRLTLVETSMDLMPDDEGARWYGYMVLEYRALMFTPNGDPSQTA